MKIKKILALLLVCAALLSLFSVTASALDPIVVEGYKEIAENEHNILFLDEATGNVAIKNKATDTLWYSCPPDYKSDNDTSGIEKTNLRSPLVFEYIYSETATLSDKTVIEVSNTAEECEESDITVEKIKNGAKVTFDVAYLEATVAVEYLLEGKTFKASILYDEFSEGEYIKMISMKLLPAFGAAKIGEDGYVVVPDGSGAVINFSNSKGANEYTSTVYGNEIDTLSYVDVLKEKTVNMPIFGLVKQNGALLGVITEGDDSAAIAAYSAYEKKYGYNTACSKAVYRMDSQISMFANNFANHNIVNQWRVSADTDRYTVSYYFLGKSQASYQGIASAYRQHLIDTGVLEKSDREPSMHVDIFGSMKKETAFLGFKYKKNVPLTTYAQAKEILSELKADGVENITAELVGWGNSGIDNEKLPAKVKFLSVLGGKRGFKKLLSYAKEENIALSAEVDFTTATKLSRKNSLMTYFNKVIYKYLYRNSVYTERRETKTAVAHSTAALKSAKKFEKSFAKQNIGGVSLAGVAKVCYTNFTPKNTQSRRDWIDNTVKILKAYDDYDITLTAANAYAFGYADVIKSAPMASSGYEIFDYDIPLYQLVLKGYITLTTESIPQTVDTDGAYLWAVTTGTEPLYNAFYEEADILQESEYDYLYSSTYTYWKDEAAEKYKKYGKLLSDVKGSAISGYSESSEVVKVSYDNGVTVYVNYGDSAKTVDGKKINARDYLWTGGNSDEA